MMRYFLIKPESTPREEEFSIIHPTQWQYYEEVI
jgi:hypothetical protein